jgi:hypothetical protein
MSSSRRDGRRWTVEAVEAVEVVEAVGPTKRAVARAVLMGLVAVLGVGAVACDDMPYDPADMVHSGSWYKTQFKWPHDGDPYEGAYVVVYSDGASLEARQTLAAIAEELLVKVKQELAITSDTLLLLPHDQEKIHIYAYRYQNPTTWSGQAYYGGLIVYSADQEERAKAGLTEPEPYRAIVTHEMVHVVQGLLLGSVHPSLVDEWLSEGLAEYLGTASIEPPVHSLARLDELTAAFGELNPIAQHIGDEYTVEQGNKYYYPMYELAVRYLVDSEGRGVPKSAFRDLFLDQRGEEPCYVGTCPEFGVAFETHFGLSLQEYEDRFFELMRAYLD